jgi:hypothetical protein
MKKSILFAVVLFLGFAKSQGQLVSDLKTNFSLTAAEILVDENDFALVKKSAALLQNDIELVTGKKIPVIHQPNQSAKNLIVIGSIGNSVFIKKLIAAKQITTTNLTNKWEAYSIQSINSSQNRQAPKSRLRELEGLGGLLVITGSDRRGVAYGVFELSKQIGVSPWYWWADVPVVKKQNIYFKQNISFSDAPKVKYRGIFINDEAPALSNWSKEKFGGFNHQFYEKVFELMLRLKSNYLWPAMWGNAFFDDDSLNIKSADEYGIVIGTSHHEPLMRAHDEWRRYGKGKWNYDSNEVRLKEFWKAGMQRATNEKIVSVGMRGDGDEPMSRETATSLLERIVKDQRQIIADVTGKPASATPQLWALYKEVQDYYDKGMRVPDDVTLLLCDDNWGNIRKLPKITDAPRKGGYGIYYHFDYVGGPRNYKWLNTNPIARVWEQMHLAYEYNVKEIWIVNVGDIKPMEFPISFFLDYAWNPEKIGADDLQKYTEQWSAAQFGNKYAKEIADIISKYTKYNGRRKPELLDQTTYSLNNYNEFETVISDYNALLAKAEKINERLTATYKDAFFQLVLYPVKACANLNELYFNVALNNRQYKIFRNYSVNIFAERATQLYMKDSIITLQYHQLNNGKWNHMMSQTHIGYTYWQQPEKQKMPAIHFISKDSVIAAEEDYVAPVLKNSMNLIPKNSTGNLFYEKQFSGVSIEANHFTKAINGNGINWKILPDHGRTGSAITTFPVAANDQKPTASSPQLQYEFYTYSKGEFKINAYFSPTLNFNNTPTGLQYAISVDNEAPQIISINKEDNNTKVWEKWVANNIIIKTSEHKILTEGKHTVKYWMVNSGVVLQKLVLDFGGVKPSYLGPPETSVKN